MTTEFMSPGIMASRSKVIETIRQTGNELAIVFVDHSELHFEDTGQDCCESRYMTCDDDLVSFTGDRFLGAEVSEVEEKQDPSSDEVHEMQFLRIKLASGSVITACSHNEHNGYYGGFSIDVRHVPA